jgi:hypothetical protein
LAPHYEFNGWFGLKARSIFLRERFGSEFNKMIEAVTAR